MALKLNEFFRALDTNSQRNDSADEFIVFNQDSCTGAFAFRDKHPYVFIGKNPQTVTLWTCYVELYVA